MALKLRVTCKDASYADSGDELTSMCIFGWPHGWLVG